MNESSSFDVGKYLSLQRSMILERAKMFDKLYLEFGGKLLDDQHAARCIPGFEPDIKIRLLEELKDDAEVVLCISARALSSHKERADYKITYGEELVREVEALRGRGVTVDSVVVTLYEGQEEAKRFAEALPQHNLTVYFHTPTKGYPEDVATIASDEGYGANPFIRTTKKIIAISAPGPCSGKMATALSQLYHESKNGTNAGYAKFETFPVWNLPVDHPLNIAYESATADLGDVNMEDYFYAQYNHNSHATNYNRDLEIFPVLKEILHRITGKDIYHSPTDMGVNMVGFCITDDKAVREASIKEILRRYAKASADYSDGKCDKATLDRTRELYKKVKNKDITKGVENGPEGVQHRSSESPADCSGDGAVSTDTNS